MFWHEVSPSSNAADHNAQKAWYDDLLPVGSTKPRADAAPPADAVGQKTPVGKTDYPQGSQERRGIGVAFGVDQGLTIGYVYPDGPAKAGGLKTDDRVVAIDGKDIQQLTGAEALRLLESSTAPTVTLTIDRQATRFNAKLTKSKFTVCPTSSTYEQFIGTAEHNYFDPKQIGNLVAFEHKYDCQITSQNDAVNFAQQAIKGIGDPYTAVWDANMLQMESSLESNRLVGIGVGLDADSGRVNIGSVVPESPADKADLMPGDRILAVDGKSVTTPQDAVNAIHRKPGESVTLTIERDGRTFDSTIVCRQFGYPTIDEKLGDGIDYIRSASFMPLDAPQQMEAALEKHADAKAFIIDMRGNGGGLVDNAIHMAELFVKNGTLTTIAQRQPSDPRHPSYTTQDVSVGRWFETRTSHTDGMLSGFWPSLRYSDVVGGRPVIILVDKATASAAEMFTSAVHDNGAAVVLGDQTFGKGIGQITVDGLPLGHGLHVTDLRYYTPAGKWLGDANRKRIGITPDVIVHNQPHTKPLSAQDKQLQEAITRLKAQLH